MKSLISTSAVNLARLINSSVTISSSTEVELNCVLTRPPSVTVRASDSNVTCADAVAVVMSRLARSNGTADWIDFELVLMEAPNRWSWSLVVWPRAATRPVPRIAGCEAGRIALRPSAFDRL